jgi:hypothetical protein
MPVEKTALASEGWEVVWGTKAGEVASQRN